LIKYFILFLLLIPICFSIDEEDTSMQKVDEFIKEMESKDPISEERSLANSYKTNMLKIGQATIYSIESKDSFTMLPEDSLRIDYYKNDDIRLEIYYDNKFPNENEYFPAHLYDIRLTTRSLDPSVNLDFTFHTTKLTESDFKTIGIKNVANMPKGTYPIEVKITGRDIMRRVHSDSAVFYMNVGLEANSTDIRYSLLKAQKEESDIFSVIFWVIGIVLLIVGLGAIIVYKKMLVYD